MPKLPDRSPADLQKYYACAICLANIRARVVDSQLRILCDGPEAHDIEQTQAVITRAARDYRIAQQEDDFFTVLAGLPEELRRQFDASDQTDQELSEWKRDHALPIQPKSRGRKKLFKTE